MTTGEQNINVMVTFRGTEPTQALKDYALEKVEGALSKYVKDQMEAHVILSVEKRDHTAEISAKSRNYDINVESTTDDLYAAIDKVIDTLVVQLRKQKERVVDQRHQVPEI